MIRVMNDYCLNPLHFKAISGLFIGEMWRLSYMPHLASPFLLAHLRLLQQLKQERSCIGILLAIGVGLYFELYDS